MILKNMILLHTVTRKPQKPGLCDLFFIIFDELDTSNQTQLKTQ